MFRLAVIVFNLLIIYGLHGQSMLSTSFESAGSASVVLSYLHKGYDEFWAGENEMTAPNDGLNQNIFTLYGRYAITDGIEIVANIPYFSNVSGNEEVEFKSIQDISLFGKVRVFDSEYIDGAVAAGTNIATGYDPGALYALGNGATTFDMLALLDFETEYGLSAGIQGGYSLRNGDVPNATLFMMSVGYGTSYFYIDFGYGFQRSTDGIDIGGPEFGGPPDFPRAKVDYQQVFASLYVPLSAQFGLVGHWGTIINGRNVGMSDYFGGGVAYNW